MSDDEYRAGPQTRKRKRIESLVPARPEQQLSLFAGFFRDDKISSYTFELDMLLPYDYGKLREADPLSSVAKEIHVGNSVIHVRRFPAVLYNEGAARGKAIFPAKREAIVERAIRKMAVQQHIQTLLMREKRNKLDEHYITVSFTLSALRRELRNANHEYKLAEIKEAIQVLARSYFELQCKTDDQLDGIEGTLFEGLRYRYGDDDEEGSRSFVQLAYHPIAARDIQAQAYFPINYDRLMALKTPLAAWLTARLNQRFRQAERPRTLFANAPVGYSIALSTILRESGMPEHGRLRKNVEQVRRSLEEMRLKGVLHSFEEEERHEKTAGRPRIADIIWKLFPSADFAGEIIDGHHKNKLAK